MKPHTLWSLSPTRWQALDVSIDPVVLRILLLMISGQQIDTVISIQHSKDDLLIRFEKGKCTGFKGAVIAELDKVHSHEDGVMHLLSQGCSYEDALKTLFQQMVEKSFQIALEQNARCVVLSSDQDVGRAVVFEQKMGELLVKQIKANQSEDTILRTYSPLLSSTIQWVDLPCHITALGLPLKLVKEYQRCSSNNLVRQCLDVDNRVTAQWNSLDIFVGLGLACIEGVMNKSSSSVESTPASIPVQTPSSQPTQASSKNTNVDVNQEQLNEWKQFLEYITSTPAYKVFGLTAPNEVNDQTIDKQFRDFSKNYHPDVHRRKSEPEKQLIGEIYDRINELYSDLQDEGTRVELKNRLDVERRGLQYVSAADSKKSELLQAQGKIFFRKRKFKEAYDVLSQAFALNPYSWRINTLKVRCEAELGISTKKEVAEILSSNKEARGADRVEILYQAGLYFLQDGEEKRAYELFAKVVEADESHIDAKRYLHLRKKKSEVDPKENAEEKTGFFSRLFGKK